MSLLALIKKGSGARTHPTIPVPADYRQPATKQTQADEGGISEAAVKLAIEGRILCVCGAASWLQELERELVRRHSSWEHRQVPDCHAAMAALGSTSFDALVLDERAPGAEEILESARRDFPRVCRIVLCDAQDRARPAIRQTALATPMPRASDAATLMETIRRTVRVSQWLAEPSMKNLMPRIRRLPALPRLYTQVTQELQSVNGSMTTVASLIAQDPVMSAKILQVVNSAVFSLSHPVTDVSEAALQLGGDRIKALILVAGVFSQFEYPRHPGFCPEEIWDHSLEVAALARTISLTEGSDVKSAEGAYTAGLLHDIGKLVLASNAPEMHQTIRQLQVNKQVRRLEAEMEILGTSHAELGACLLGTWALPLSLLEAIAWHHRPRASTDHDFSLLTAVHAANVCWHQQAKDSVGASSPMDLDIPYLERIGLKHRAGPWRQACGLPG